MWRNARILLIILSLGLNIGFGAMWIGHVLAARATPPQRPDNEDPVWCPLHRQLGVSLEQWREIEPRWQEFRKSSQPICQSVTALRQEMIALVAAPEPDRKAIQLKQDEILAGQRKMQDLVVENLLAEKKSLTPDQQAKLFALLRSQTGCSGGGPAPNSTGPAHGERGPYGVRLDAERQSR